MGKSRFIILKQIIELYEEYDSAELQMDVLSFAKWMIKKLEEEPDLIQKASREKKPENYNEGFSVVKSMDEKTRFLESITRIARYHELYSRKVLKDLIINTRLEYLFLQAIHLMEKARKTDIISAFNLEYTTGMDTIRRLTNNGLLNEIPDEQDKRVRLLALTEKGEEILDLANKRMSEEYKMFLTAINANKWKKALPVIEEIDEFHSSVFQNYSDKSFAELKNLMDSLKYLYK